MQVKQGCEPPTFSCYFLGWNPNLWAQDTSYESYRKQLSEGVTAVAEELKKYDDRHKFKYEELKGKNCPTGVDASRKEVGDVHTPFIIKGSIIRVDILWGYINLNQAGT